MIDPAVFEQIQEKIDEEIKESDAIKLEVRELERFIRVARFGLNSLYTADDATFKSILLSTKDKLSPVYAQLACLAQNIPALKFYKYQNLWSSSSQQICFMLAMIVFLMEDRMLTVEDVHLQTGFPVLLKLSSDGATEKVQPFHFTLEDYLHGLISLSNELPRLAIMAVSHQKDYKRPQRLANFLSSLYADFQLLNLKNDNLRRRFDSIKYDIKKIEEVVYDLSVRNLSA